MNNNFLRLQQLKADADKIVPSPTELAMIAATLAHGRVDKSDLAQEAIALWNACDYARARDIETKAEMRLNSEKAKPTPSIPKPSKFPVPLDEFLRLALPDAKKTFRQEKFLDYLDHALRIGRVQARVYPPDGTNKIEWKEADSLEPSTTPKERAAKWNELEQNGIQEWHYESWYVGFRNWLESTNREIKSANAKSGHAKKRK